MIQSLGRSIYEKTRAKKYRQKWRRNVAICWFHRFCLYEAWFFFGFVEVIRIGCEKRRIIGIARVFDVS